MSWILSTFLLCFAQGQEQPKAAPPATPAPQAAPAPDAKVGQDPNAPKPAPPQEGSPFLQLLFPLALCFVIIYFMMIRPQKRQMKEREAMLGGMRKGDEVVTSSGIIGVVQRMKDKDNEVVIVIDPKNDIQIRVLKSAVMTIRKKSGEEEKEKPSEETKKEPEGTNKG